MKFLCEQQPNALMICLMLQNLPDGIFSLQDVLTLWLKNFAHDSPLSRAQLATIVAELLPSRQKRDVGMGVFSDP